MYCQPKKLDDITLDMVIMAPDMPEPSIDPNTANPATHVWAVVEDWAVDDEAGHNEDLYISREDAIAVFHSKLNTEAEEGCIPRWSGDDDFQLDAGDTVYECWLDGHYIGNHFKIALEQKLLVQKFTAREENK